jgi:hypothetical protein
MSIRLVFPSGIVNLFVGGHEEMDNSLAIESRHRDSAWRCPYSRIAIVALAVSLTFDSVPVNGGNDPTDHWKERVADQSNG